MTPSRHIRHALVAILLAVSAVRLALTSTPLGGQLGSSTPNNSSNRSSVSFQDAVAAASDLPSATYSGPSRSLQDATPESADASASASAVASSSQRKQLLPLSARDVLLFVFAAGMLALAAASGIGGGVLLVPWLSMVGGFQFIEAVALSNVACLAGAVTNLMFNITRKNPVRPGPLIDYDLLLLFGPPIVMGSIAGAKANYFIPSWITKTLLMVVLTPMVWRMVKKAKFLWVAESNFKRQALAEIQAATADGDAADTDADSITAAAAAAEAAEDGDCCIADDTATGTLKSAPVAATASGPGTGLRNTLSTLRQAGCTPSRCSSATLAAAVAAAAADGPDNNHLRRAFSDTHAGPRLRPNHSGRHNMRPLPELTPSTDLVDVLGPELMLLTSPAAARAAVQVQHAGRELQRQRLGPSRSLQHALFLNWSVPLGSGTLDVRGSSFRARSMVTVRGTCSLPASRSGSWVKADGAGAGAGTGVQLRVSGDAAGSGGRAAAADSLHAAAGSVGGAAAADTLHAAAGSVGGAAAADTLHAAAFAPVGGLRGSGSLSSRHDRSSSVSAHQQQQQLVPDAEADYGMCGRFDSGADVEDNCKTLDAITPFALHQRQLSPRQDSLKRNGSGIRQGSMRQGSFVSRCSSMGPAGSITIQQQTTRQLHSPNEEEAVQCKAAQGQAIPCKAVQCKAATGEGAAAGKDVELPVAGKSHCMRLNHKDCWHTPELEGLMMDKIEYHISHQYPKIHLAGLLGMLLVVVATAVCSQFLLQCGTWQFWLVVLSPIPTMTIVWALTRWHVLWRVGWQECLGLMSQAEIAWDARNTLVYPAVCTSVGVLAGLLGIGGGSVMAPMLLELGVHPQTSAASSQAAILISTATAAVIYLVNRSVPQDYGITIILIGFFATLLGQTAITYLVQRTGRNSLLVFILAFLFVAALGLSVAAVALAVAKIVADPSLLLATRKSDLCHSSQTA